MTMARTSVRRLQQQKLQVAFLRDSMLAPANANLGMNANGGQEPEWKERLRRWKMAQLSQRAVTDMTDKELETLKNCTFSVLGCLQAEFKCEELQKAVE